jgi:hypothetical protein
MLNMFSDIWTLALLENWLKDPVEDWDLAGSLLIYVMDTHLSKINAPL